nr:serine/arginine-rich splicing factor 8-like [Saimiri boliviensis boliviensis]
MTVKTRAATIAKGNRTPNRNAPTRGAPPAPALGAVSCRRPHPDVDGTITLKADSLTYGASPDSPRHAGDVHVPWEPHTKAPRVFAFFRFHDRRDAEAAEAAVDAAGLDRWELRVQVARYGRRGAPRSWSRGGGYGPWSCRPRRRHHSRSRGPSCSRSLSQSRYRRSCYSRFPYRESPCRESHYRGSPYRGSPYRRSHYRGSPYRGSPYRGSPYSRSPYRGSHYNWSLYRGSHCRGSPYSQSPYRRPSLQRISLQRITLTVYLPTTDLPTANLPTENLTTTDLPTAHHPPDDLTGDLTTADLPPEDLPTADLPTDDLLTELAVADLPPVDLTAGLTAADLTTPL